MNIGRVVAAVVNRHNLTALIVAGAATAPIAMAVGTATLARPVAAAEVGVDRSSTTPPAAWSRALELEPVAGDDAAAWTCTNPGLGAVVTFTVNGGIRATFPDDPDGTATIGFSLTGVGDAFSTRPTPALSAWTDGARLDVETAELWFRLVNQDGGVAEHFHLESPPIGWDGSSPIVLAFEADEDTVVRPFGERAIRIAAGSAPERFLAELRLADAHAADGRRLTAKLGTDEGGIRLRVEAGPDDFPITLKLLLEPPTWVVWGGQADAQAGYAVATAGDVNGDGYSDVVVGSPEWDNGQSNEGRVRVYHGGPAGLSTTASWSWESNQAGANAGMSVATAGDVNGDGYSDLIVGAPYWNGAAGADQGAAFIFLGSASGLASSPHVTLTFAWAGGLFGFSVSSAGDVNGDGYSDVIVGAPEARLGGAGDPAGGAFVFHGSAAGVDATADWSQTGYAGYYENFGYRVALAGDVNGDGYSDVLVGSPDADEIGCGFFGDSQCDWGRVAGWLGSPSGVVGNPFLNTWGESAPGWQVPYERCNIGQSLATLGDLDGDGYSDFAFGSPDGCVDGGGNSTSGLIRVWRGTSTGAVQLTELVGWNAADPGRGASLFTAGDINGDGYADLVFGMHDPTDLDAVGRVVVRLGTPTGYNGEVVIDPGYQSTGWAVSLAGDVNGDGYSDLIGGAPYANGTAGGDEGAAFVWYGRDTGADAATDGVWIEGPAAGYQLGQALAFMDANHDGIDDLLIGAPGQSAGHGTVYLHLGRSGQLPDPIQTRQYPGTGANDQQGAAVAAGDLTGDGFEDLVVGVPGPTSDGQIRIYCGTAGGYPASTPCASLTGAPGDGLGRSLAVLGDVNGDGIADLAAGAPGHRVSTIDLGAVYLWLGSADGIEGAPDAIYLGQQAGAWFGQRVARTGDVNRDGFADFAVSAPSYDNGGLNAAGAVWVYHGRQASPPDGIADRELVGTEAAAFFGWGLAGAGDVNGDGYADLLVGEACSDVGGWDSGRAILYPGSAAGISGTAAWSVDGSAPLAHLGWTVAGGGDLNGDGYSDVTVAAPNADTTYFAAVHPQAGEAWTYLGGPTGLAAAGTRTIGLWDGGWLGWAAAMAGDLNGDGFADLALGAPEANSTAGMVVVLSRRLGPAVKPRQSNSDASPIPYQGATAAADAFRLTLGTRTIFGRGYVNLEVENKTLGTAFNGLGLLRDASWSNSSGVTTLFQEVEGLAAATAYHWRSRQLYRPTSMPLQPHGPWRSRPLGSWAEADLRTPPATPADLRVSIATNAPQINLGNQYFATVTVANLAGGFTAQDVELTLWGSFMSLTGLTVTAGVNGSCSQVASDWVCTFTDPIPTGASRSVIVYGDTNAVGNLTLFAQAIASNGDLDLGNNFDSESTPVVLPPGLELIVNNLGNGADANPGNSVCETAAGNGVCTLRAAVGEANALAGHNTVTIAVAGTIAVSGGIAITDDVTIRSGLTGHAVISGGGTSRIFNIADASYPEVTFERLDLINAHYWEAGSAVFLDQAGDVGFLDCRISDNFSESGGAVGVGSGSEAGNLVFEGCAFADNTSEVDGGAISIAGSPGYQRGLLEIRSSTFSGNDAGSAGGTGGAIAVTNTNWDLLITDSAFSGNVVSSEYGGAIAITSVSNPSDRVILHIERSSFVGNQASGGATSVGGAIASLNGDVHLVNCTFSGNSAGLGSAVAASGGRLALSESTLAGNSASSSGGAVYGASAVQVLAAATILAANTPANCAGVGTVTGNFNLSSDASCTFSGSSNLSSTPAQLGSALGGPGGLIYYPPLAGSPVLDSAGVGLCLDAYGDVIDDDMLGAARPADGDGDGAAICDRGAVELQMDGLLFADGFESGNLSGWASNVP